MTERIDPRAGSISRPRHLVGVAGTGTDVGKTYWTVRIVRQLLRHGWTVQVRKPAQSYNDGTVAADTDAGLLADVAGLDPEFVCPPHRWYPVAMAPPIAAHRLGRDPVSMDDLVRETEASWSGRAADFALVETAGGARSPLADRPGQHGDDCAAFLSALGVDEVLLIADAGLGTIHSVRTSLDRLRAVGFEPTSVTVGLSRFDPADPVHVANLAWLHDRDGLTVVNAPDQIVRALIDGAPEHCVRCGEVISSSGTPRRQTATAGLHNGISPEKGQVVTESEHRCANLHEVQLDVGLEPDRFCGRCGRRMRVVITPTRTDAVCVEHGAEFRHAAGARPVAE